MTVGETENFYAWLEVNPRARGHTMVVPKEHTENLLELPMDQWNEAFELVREVIERVKKGLDADGVSVAVNIEEAGGQMLPHAYIIVFPRFESDENAGTPTGAIFPQQEELQQELDSIQADMSNVSVDLGESKKEAHPESQNFKDVDEIDEMLRTSDIAKKAKESAGSDNEDSEEQTESSDDSDSEESQQNVEADGLSDASKQQIFQELLSRYENTESMVRSSEFQQILDSTDMELRKIPGERNQSYEWR
jgi:histidine triad (HIT) family protein